MKRRSLFKTGALALLNDAIPRFMRAQSHALSHDDMQRIAAIGEAILPSSLSADGRQKAVDQFLKWLEGYKAGVRMSFGYGGKLKSEVVPPSPILRYPAQFARLEELSKEKGSPFTDLTPLDRKTVIEAALIEVKVTKLPSRPDGQHVASDLMSHFFSSSDGNDFLFQSAIRASDCRGLSNSANRPDSIA